MPRPQRVKRIRKPRFWVLKVFLGLALLGTFAYSVVDYRQFEANAQHVSGKVLSVKRETHATGRRGGRVVIERPFVQFTLPASARTAAREITTTAKVLSRRDFSTGQLIPLEFDPSRIEESLRVESGIPLPDIAFGLVGLALVVFGVAELQRYRALVKIQGTQTV